MKFYKLPLVMCLSCDADPDQPEIQTLTDCTSHVYEVFRVAS